MFDRQYLKQLGATADGLTRWLYRHPTDLLNDILATPTYFDGANDIIKAGDAVFIESLDGSAETCIEAALSTGEIRFDATPFNQGGGGGGAGTVNLTVAQSASNVTITPSGGGVPAVILAGTSSMAGVISPAQALQLANLGTASSRNVGTSAGDVPELDASGQIPTSLLPSVGGLGDMLAATYDPNNINGDAFARTNHTGFQPIGTVTGLQGLLDSKVDDSQIGSGANQIPILDSNGFLPATLLDQSHGGFSQPISTFNPVTDGGTHALVDCNANAVNIQLPDVTAVDNGTHIWLFPNSNNFPASVTATVPGQLVSRTIVSTHNPDIDTVFIGLSQAAQRGSWVKVTARSGAWRVSGLLRDTSGADYHADVVGGGGGGGTSTGDMLASTYDPAGITANVYDRANHIGIQPISSVSGLQTSLNGKSDATHNHTIADITNLQTQLNARVLTSAVGNGANQIPTLNGDGLFTQLNLDNSHAGFSTASPIYDPVADPGTHALVDCSGTAVDIQLPDVATVPNGTHIWLYPNSAANPASVTATVPGQLQSQSIVSTHANAANTIFIGLSQAKQLGSWVKVAARSGAWRVSGYTRNAANADNHADVVGGGGGGGSGSVAIEQNNAEILATADRINFAGAGVSVANAGGNEATVTISGVPAGGGAGLYGSWEQIPPGLPAAQFATDFANAVATARANGTGVVLLAGNHDASQTTDISLDGATVPIRGEYMAKTVVELPGGDKALNAQLFLVTGNVDIADITFVNGAHVCFIRNTFSTRINDIRFARVTIINAGALIRYDAQPAFAGASFGNIQVEDCEAYNVNHFVYFLGGDSVTTTLTDEFVVRNCHIDGFAGTAIGCFATDPPAGNSWPANFRGTANVYNNVIKNGFGTDASLFVAYGITTTACRISNIHHNVLINLQKNVLQRMEGIYVKSEEYFIENNYLYDVGDSTVGGGAITMKGDDQGTVAKKAVCRNNRVEVTSDTRFNGIWVQAANAEVTDNTLIGPWGGSAIGTQSSTEHRRLKVIGNTIEVTGNNQFGNPAIDITGWFDQCEVSENRVYNISGNSHAIGIRTGTAGFRSCNDCLIRDNHVFNDSGGSGDAIRLDRRSGPLGNIVIQGNVSRGFSTVIRFVNAVNDGTARIFQNIATGQSNNIIGNGSTINDEGNSWQ